MNKLLIVLALVVSYGVAFAGGPPPINPPKQVTSAEITAGTETKLRSYSPEDVKAFVDTHAPGGSGYIDVSGTPVADDIAQFTDANTVKGMTYAELAAIAGFESALEGVLDLPDLQGAVTDAQVPNTITIDQATLATTLTISDNENTAETNAILFTSGGDIDGGNLGIESDGDLTYNPSTGTLAATIITDGTVSLAGDGTITGVVEGGLPNSIIVTADIKDGDITEADLKVVDSPSDEDIFTYESTTGDFEWHSVAEVKASMSLDAVENTALSTWAGSTNITTVGTIGTGTWQGDAIGTTYAGVDLDTSNFASALAFAEGDLIDLSAITMSAGVDEGLALPTYADVAPTTEKYYAAYDAANNRIMVRESGGWVDTSAGSGAATSLNFVVTSAEGSLSDESVLTAGNAIDITDAGGDGGAVTVAFDPTEVSADGFDTWSDGSQAAIAWTFDVSGTDYTMTAGSGVMTFGDAVIVTDTLTAINGIALGVSKAITGTTAVALGDNTQTWAVNSSDWDIDATGVMTGIGNITSDGVVTATGFTIGSAAITEEELEIIDGATLTTTQLEYLNAATGTTGTASTNLVFSASPTIDSPTFTTAITATDLIDSAHYVADSIDNEHINWADIDNLDDEGMPIDFALTAEATVADDIAIRFGGAATDWYFEFDDSVDDQMLVHSTATAAVATTDPMFEILVDFGTANGTGMTADQQVFGIAKGTQASNVALLTVDEDGDLEINGTFTSNSSGDSYLQLNNNSSISPSGNRIYFEGNELEVSENGSEETILTDADGATLTGTTWDFSSVTNFVLPSAAADASGEISISTGDQLKWHDGTKVVTIDTTVTTDNYVLKYDNATATFNLEADATGGTPSIDTVTDATSDATIAFDAGEEMSWQYTGNYTTGAQFLIQQQTGNPTGGTLFEVRGADADSGVLEVGDGTNVWTVSTAGLLTNAGTATLNLAAASDLTVGGGQIDYDDMAGAAVVATTGGINCDEDVDIDFNAADEELSIVNSAEYGADGAQVTIENTDADVGAAMYLLRLRYTDDGQANADFAVFEDNNGDDMITFTDGGAITAAGAIIAGAGVDLGTSQALVGTTAMTIGNNGQTVAVNSSDWDIDATGIMTGMGNITSNGTIEGATLTEGGVAVLNNDEMDASSELAAIIDDETGSTGTPLIVFNQNPTIDDITIGSAGVKLSDDGDGALTFAGLGDGSDENLTINLDDTADTIVLSSSTGVAELDFSSFNMVTNGIILGGINVKNHTAATYTNGTDDPDEVGGTYHFNSDNDAFAMTLETAAAGHSGCLENGQGVTAALTLTPATGDYLVVEGVRGTAATAYTSTGAAGDKICWVMRNADDVTITATVGTWSE